LEKRSRSDQQVEKKRDRILGSQDLREKREKEKERIIVLAEKK